MALTTRATSLSVPHSRCLAIESIAAGHAPNQTSIRGSVLCREQPARRRRADVT